MQCAYGNKPAVRIRQLLIIGIGLAFGLVLMRLLVLELHVRDGQRLDQFQLNVERISRDAASLAVLSQDVILHHGAGSARRWRAVHASLTRTLPAVSGLAPDFQDDVDALASVAQGLLPLFGAIEAALIEPDRPKVQPRLELLADHLAIETRRISGTAFELLEKLTDRRRVRDQENRLITWATMSGFALLMLGLAVVVARLVLRPMAGLQVAAQAVRRGSLGVRSGYRSNDEFGDLSRDFDDMTHALQLRTAERERGEALLQTAHDRFEIAADSADIGVWEYDIGAGMLVWDDRMYRLYGRERSASLEPASFWADSLHPDDRARSETALQNAMLGSHDYDPEFRVVWASGEVRYLKASSRVSRDSEGVALRMTGVNIDITERKRAELKLVSTTSLLRTVLDSASEVAIIATDPEFQITVFNAGAERLLGYADTEMVGRATPMLIHDIGEMQARGAELSALLGRTVEGPAVFTEPSTLHEPREWTYVRKDNSRVTVSLVVTAMQADDGRIFGHLGIAYDATRQKAHEESLRKAMHAAHKATLAKSQFLANMSHEIRTPMNAVMGLSYLLEQTCLDVQQADYLGKISLASKSLLALINDILDLSKVEAGELTLERRPFRLDHLLKNLADVMGVHADAKSITFTIDEQAELPVGLVGDVMRLNQILTNLLANAIKFTGTGGVKLVIQQLGAGPNGVRLRFSIQDTGIGIEPKEQVKLFEPFTQADASTSRRFGGTGLGLSIVRRLTTAMGGAVGFASTPNVGSEFWVELEFALAAPTDFAHRVALPPGQLELPGVRVLVVDDSAVNLEVARRILELEGAQVTLACNGQEAYDTLQAAPQAFFDVVLMDVQMPVLNGYQATRRIRDELGLTTLPVLALTAGAMTSERQCAAEAGMDDLIAKPFDPRGLALTVRRYVRRELDMPAERCAIADNTALLVESPWPVIEGIDGADVSLRLGGDVALFRSILARLLDEFSEVTLTMAKPNEAALTQQAARMHKLRGGAGTLGIHAVYKFAEEAETACLAGDAEHASKCARRLATELQALRANAAVFLAKGVEELEREAPPGDAETDPQLLVELNGLLRQHSMEALDRFSAAATSLRRTLGKQCYETVRDHIDKLQFEDAARALVARVPLVESHR